MIAAPTVTLPGSRVVHTWWRELSGLQPQRLWFAHLLLHRLEVLVEVSAQAPLFSLSNSLLALMSRSSPFRIASLAAELQLDRGFLLELTSDLARRGLVRPVHQGDGDLWETTAPGQQESQPGIGASSRPERRSFFFTEGPPSIYLPLAQEATTTIPPPDGWRFDLAELEACVQQSTAWKNCSGFPLEVQRVIRLGEENPESWQAVPVERAEQALLVLVETANAGEVLGFPVRADGWSMGRAAVLSMRLQPEEAAPLRADIGPDAWRQAWQVWCQQRGVPPGEVDACKLEVAGHRLLVRAPGRLIERLRAARSDALKGEAWLLAGSGRVRAVALIELGEPA